MPRLKQQDREATLDQTRTRFLDAAAEEIARSGYDAANINSISLAGGFAKGTIYNYFSSKRELMFALIETTAARHVEFISSAVLVEPDAENRLERLFTAGFEFVQQHLSPARVMITTLYGPDEEFKARLFAAYQPAFRLVEEEILAPGIREGVFREVDPQPAAILLMTFYLGTASQVNEEGRLYLDPRQISNFLLNGLRR
ncbi:MAG TPA: TetR/AcrR family transcriptional regulator [Anaerolineaceae bacterium]|nr:TetR/AcrR family transcriptional regulator [Anaerolineaceae bacterium]